MNSSSLTVLSAMLALACGPPIRGPIAGTFELRRVGDRAPTEYQALGKCLVPVEARYTFRDSLWREEWRLELDSACDVQDAQPDQWTAPQIDSGYFRVTERDSVNFYVWHSRIGVQGWVNWAYLRGDTLLFRAGEFDPGDFIYVRVPHP